MQNKIFVTQPALPPLEEFQSYLEKIWASKWLTNQGEYHQTFEKELAEYLGVKYVSLFANGTLALISALQVLRITGEVITTPFSFVASTHALHWNGIKPVFVDIEERSCNIDAEKIEAAITPKTTAILPVHVYGTPVNIDKVQQIADIYGLHVIYDAAHAFGVKLGQTSILNYGDLSVLSFHATKPFTTMEGGAIVSHDEKTKKRIDFIKNFGFADETTVVAPGINAKMNEMQAALGIIQLKHYGKYVKKRKSIAQLYQKALAGVKGISLLEEREEVEKNYSYFPIFIDKNFYGIDRDSLYHVFRKNNIYTRRYFYPLISQFPTYKSLPSSNKGNLPIAEKITQEVLCLPIYPDLNLKSVKIICDLIKANER